MKKQPAKTSATQTATKQKGVNANPEKPEEFEEQRSNKLRMKPQPLKKTGKKG